MGIGFPLATIITMVFGYRQLIRHSPTTWDRDEALVVTRGKLNILRTLLATGCFAAFFSPIVFSQTNSWTQPASSSPENGIRLVLRVETDAVVNQELLQDADRISQELKVKNISIDSSSKGKGYSVEITGVDSDRANEVHAYLKSTYDRKYSLQTSTLGKKENFSLILLESYIREMRESTVRQTMETIHRRLDAMGIRNPRLQIGGNSGDGVQDQIIVELPGVPDPARVKSLLENTAQLELRLVKKDQNTPYSSVESAVEASGGRIADGYEPLPFRQNRGEQAELQYLIVSKTPVITGKDLKTTRRSIDSNGRPCVVFFLAEEGAKRFGWATEHHIGEKLAIVMNKVVSSAPTINGRIESEGIINGQFTEQQAEDLALLLRTGALPAPLRVLEDREIGNSSGSN
jgi:preprotein translocase subunit SecD